MSDFDLTVRNAHVVTADSDFLADIGVRGKPEVVFKRPAGAMIDDIDAAIDVAECYRFPGLNAGAPKRGIV